MHQMLGELAVPDQTVERCLAAVDRCYEAFSTLFDALVDSVGSADAGPCGNCGSGRRCAGRDRVAPGGYQAGLRSWYGMRSRQGIQAAARSGVIIRPTGLDTHSPSRSSVALLTTRLATDWPMPGGSMSQVPW